MFLSAPITLVSVSKAWAQTVNNLNGPEFYKKLSGESGDFSIIEYPAIVKDKYNPVPYYQAFHNKKVMRGYYISHALKKRFGTKEMLKTTIWPLEMIFSRLEIKKIYFTFFMNFFPDIIDLYDINSIRNSGARYILLHKNIKGEILTFTDRTKLKNELIHNADNLDLWDHFYRSSLHFRGYYLRYMGAPVYEDDLLIVFKVRQSHGEIN